MGGQYKEAARGSVEVKKVCGPRAGQADSKLESLGMEVLGKVNRGMVFTNSSEHSPVSSVLFVLTSTENRDPRLQICRSWELKRANEVVITANRKTLTKTELYSSFP